MNAPLDPYHRWLGIPPAEQPADHYRLLNIERFETDPEVIQNAAIRQMSHVRGYALGPQASTAHQILSELAVAKACLANESRRREYDRSLTAGNGVIATDAENGEIISATQAAANRSTAAREITDCLEDDFKIIVATARPARSGRKTHHARGPAKDVWRQNLRRLQKEVGQVSEQTLALLTAVLTPSWRITTRQLRQRTGRRSRVRRRRDLRWRIDGAPIPAGTTLVMSATMCLTMLWLALAQVPQGDGMTIAAFADRQLLVLPRVDQDLVRFELLEELEPLEAMMVASVSLNQRRERTQDVPSIALRLAVSQPAAERWGNALPERFRCGSRRIFFPPTNAAPLRDVGIRDSLDWLSRHQDENGSWNFHFAGGVCANRCPNPGNRRRAETTATALALLPLLVAIDGLPPGHAHQKYERAIADGIAFLLPEELPYDFSAWGKDGGGMYTQALVTLALALRYQQTKEDRLMEFAGSALDVIVASQDRRLGGWRMNGTTTPDTITTAWQLLALRAGQQVLWSAPEDTYHRSHRFLSSVQAADNFTYGFRPQARSGGATSAGHYARHLANDRLALADEELERLLLNSLRNHDLLDCLFATQLLGFSSNTGHQGWRNQLRVALRDAQEKSGHAKGSWYFEEAYSDQGGRLYYTALAALVLLATDDRYLLANEPPPAARHTP